MIEFEKTEKSTLEIWAEKEIAMACERERASNSKEDWDYGVACYESALRAFQSLLRDGHSGFSISLTQSILNRLIDGKPLTPITEKNAEWKDISWHGLNDGVQKFQSGRMSSLFKEIHPDGTVTYSDVERFVCVDEDGHGCYHSSLVDRVVSKIFPITFPYYSASYKIYCSDCLTDHRNGDFDTVAIFYAIDEKGTRTDIYRYFKACLNDWREIERLEWTRRKAKAGILRKEK